MIPAIDDEEFISQWEASRLEDRHIEIYDEFGNTGQSQVHETKFGFGISEVFHPILYADIAELNDFFHGVAERKARDSPLSERYLLSSGIRLLGTKTYCAYVDKNGNLPQGMERAPHKRIRGILGASLDRFLPPTGVVWVLVDSNDQYKGSDAVKRICASRSNSERIVRGRQYPSNKCDFPSYLLQTHDYVTNAARSAVEFGKCGRADILGIDFKQIDAADRFSETDMAVRDNVTNLSQIRFVKK